MNKSEIVRGLADQVDLPIPQVDEVVSQFLDLLSLSLACGESVLLSGFGKFDVRDRDEVVRRNPRTREEVVVPPKRALVFKPSHQLKERMNRVPKLPVQLDAGGVAVGEVA